MAPSYPLQLTSGTGALTSQPPALALPTLSTAPTRSLIASSCFRHMRISSASPNSLSTDW